MKIACYCGHYFEGDSKHAACPRCGTLAIMPKLSDKDADEMRKELDIILGEHEPKHGHDHKSKP